MWWIPSRWPKTRSVVSVTEVWGGVLHCDVLPRARVSFFSTLFILGNRHCGYTCLWGAVMASYIHVLSIISSEDLAHVFPGETTHIFLLWLFGNSAVVLTVVTPHCVRAPAIDSKLKFGAYPPASVCSLMPSLFNLPEPCDSWHPWADIFYYFLHMNKAMRHLSLSVWPVSLNTVSCRFFPVVMNVVISSFLGQFLWVCECCMKQYFIGHLLFSYSHDSAA